MKTTLLRSFSFIFFGMAGLIFSCQTDEDRLTIQDTADIIEEALTESLFQDADDLASVVISAPSDDEYDGGRKSATITIEDDRFNCDGIEITIESSEGSTPQHPKGVISVDFGTTGCNDLRGNIRKGKLIFTYDGWRFQPGSKVITTTSNYYINNVRLEGTRTLTNITGSSTDAPKFNVVLVGGKAIFSDSREATRESNITWTWIRGANPTLDEIVISANSTAEGATRGGRAYEVIVTEPLHYKRLCGIPAAEGIKRYVVDGDKEIIVDYGDGSCDKSVTVTVNGVTRVLTVQ